MNGTSSFEWVDIKESKTTRNPPKFEEFPFISDLNHKRIYMLLDARMILEGALHFPNLKAAK